MPKRRPTASYSAGERLENQARAAAKKTIAPTTSNAEVLLAHIDISDDQAAAVTRLVVANAYDDADREQLLDALGIREVAV